MCFYDESEKFSEIIILMKREIYYSVEGFSGAICGIDFGKRLA